MPSLDIRTASALDAALIETLARQIWTQHYVSIISMEQIQYMLEKNQSESAIIRDMGKGTVYEIACSDGEPCGYSASKLESEGLFLSKLYVKQDHRGKGFARELLKRIETRAREHSATRIWLRTHKRNAGSIAAYKRLGFDIAYSCVTDIGNGFVMDDYVLEKAVLSSD